MGKFCLGDIKLVDTDSKLDISNMSNIPVGLELSWDGTTLKCNSGYVKSNNNNLISISEQLSIGLSSRQQAIDDNILLGTAINWESILQLSTFDNNTNSTDTCTLLNVGTSNTNGAVSSITTTLSPSVLDVINGSSYGYIDVIFKQPLLPGEYRIYHYIQQAFIYTSCTYQTANATLSDDGTSYTLTRQQSWQGTQGDVGDIYFTINPNVSFNAVTYGYSNAVPGAPGRYGGGQSRFDFQKAVINNNFNVYLCKDSLNQYKLMLAMDETFLSDYEYAQIGQIDFSTITVAPTNDLYTNYISGNILTNQSIDSFLGGLKFTKISQVDYNNLVTKDENTVYFIIS